MPTTLTFELPSHPSCPALACGVDDGVFVKLKPSFLDRSADGSGYLRSVVATVLQLTSALWRYTVTVPDSEIASGMTLTADHVEPSLSCITGADAAILAKPLNWLFHRAVGTSGTLNDGRYYITRRHFPWRIHAMELAITSASGSPTIEFGLAKTGTNDIAWETIDGVSAEIVLPLRTTRVVFAEPILIEAQRSLAVDAASSISNAATGLDVHLFTSEIH